MKRLIFRLGAWLMSITGEAGRSEYVDALERAHIAENARARASYEVHRAVQRNVALLRAACLADGLLSSGKVAHAQAQLRIGIIAAGGGAGDRTGRGEVSLWQ